MLEFTDSGIKSETNKNNDACNSSSFVKSIKNSLYIYMTNCYETNCA